jgi:hypothetical protein
LAKAAIESYSVFAAASASATAGTSLAAVSAKSLAALIAAAALSSIFFAVGGTSSFGLTRGPELNLLFFFLLLGLVLRHH